MARFSMRSSFLAACAAMLSLVLMPKLSPSVSAQSEPIISTIKIQGNKRVNDDMINAKIKSRVGEPFSKITVQEDIKRLYGLGYFDDIQADIDAFEGGIRLVFTITEKPFITSIDFQGNKEFEEKDLREKITLTTGAIANPQLILDNTQMLLTFYQSEGYWLTKAVPVIREINKDSVALTFQIDEGPKVAIDKIIIEGNKAVSRKDILKAMKTKEKGIFSFITKSGIYLKQQITEDLERIKELYQSRGYLYAAVSGPEIALSQNRKKLTLTLSVSEGEQYKFGDLKFRGNTVFTTDELFGQIKIATGQIFNRTALRTDIDKMIDMYLDKGYARADINPIVDVNEESRIAHIMFDVREGDIYHIGKISISGNTKTRDKVIRREVRLDEGDVFSKSLLKRSYQRINNLNFFESVEINPYPKAEEKLIDLNINVKEKLTGMLSLGGGYSSVDKFMVMSEVTQTNLFGKGLYLKFKADFSSRRTNYNVSLKDPWFMDKPITASIGLYNDSYEYPDYDKKATGGTIGFGKELSEYVYGNITYDLENVRIDNISENASSSIRDQEGEKLTSSISPSIWKDTRDNYIDPTTGYKNALYTTFAGIGGDNYFVKATADSMWFFPVMWNTTFSIRGRAGYATGYAGETLPLYERYYVGGINTVRGLGFGEAGPRDEKGEKIGGNYEFIINVEYIFPLVEEARLKGLVFFDYGSSFDKDDTFSFSDMRKTAGVGLRWLSPLGPLRLEWGFNLDQREDESANKLEFTVGGFF